MTLALLHTIWVHSLEDVTYTLESINTLLDENKESLEVRALRDTITTLYDNIEFLWWGISPEMLWLITQTWWRVNTIITSSQKKEVPEKLSQVPPFESNTIQEATEPVHFPREADIDFFPSIKNRRQKSPLKKLWREIKSRAVISSPLTSPSEKIKESITVTYEFPFWTSVLSIQLWTFWDCYIFQDTIEIASLSVSTSENALLKKILSWERFWMSPTENEIFAYIRLKIEKNSFLSLEFRAWKLKWIKKEDKEDRVISPNAQTPTLPRALASEGHAPSFVPRRNDVAKKIVTASTYIPFTKK